jgi:hypothetical protein
MGNPGQHVPTMLIVVGKSAAQAGHRPYRWSPREIVRLQRWDGEALE